MSGEVSRRRALQIAALGAVGAITGAVGTWRSFLTPASEALPERPGQELLQPRVLSSRGGSLDVRLRAAPGVTVAGRRTRALGYNGTVPGPTLRVRPGDRLRVEFVNDLDSATNLHTHGLHVSPEGRSDNVFRHVGAGKTMRYEYAIPDDHPPGTFWYHPHMHGSVADQVFGGLYGTIVVVGAGEPSVDRERVLVVSDITLSGDGRVIPVSGPQIMAGREGELVLVNGQLRPTITTAPGTVERWRVLNACTSRFLRLRLDGHTLGLLGYDGQALSAPRDRDSVVLAPGNRTDFLVRLERAGSFRLRTLDVDRGGMGMMSGGSGSTSRAAELATVEVGGRPSATTASPGSAEFTFRPAADLRGAALDRRRTITFTMQMSMGGASFGFDGQEFDPARTDQKLQLGTVEEWTIGNDTPMDHPFHLHVWPMQVVDAPDHDPSGPPDWRDVVIVPARGQVRVRVPISDFGGQTVYHCHILDHEDRGMMAVVVAQP
ncbi:multicopper oxidase family protein [Microlunatus panaciterrae]|uniref:FtsP/CotA-like multicopper oxidase with cupredoxin domain n=1 Tax=Microlunatus panaciterrae TaxID=400768 RepID=A0ABS2RJS5_9ACTN|nr:multicopper oxidase family protein [Microlunatus panaciterrae]MBM7798742.1 FtsP/CotA-like multicopper oxidase with cupredoxin domain [Microlunatus panaciterrae]